MTLPSDPSDSNTQAPTKPYQVLGGAALLIALLLRGRKPIVYSSLLAGARRFASVPTADQALRVRQAVTYAGKIFPTRIACLEASLATAIAGALIGRMPVWCMGVRFSPLVYHQWVEALDGDGNLVPIGEEDTDPTWPYKSVLRV